jgi:hypothetical protein
MTVGVQIVQTEAPAQVGQRFSCAAAPAQELWLQEDGRWLLAAVHSDGATTWWAVPPVFAASWLLDRGYLATAVPLAGAVTVRQQAAVVRVAAIMGALRPRLVLGPLAQQG